MTTPPAYFKRPSGPVSAVVVDADGGLVTSLYNVRDDPDTVVTRIEVRLADGRRFPATVKGTDPNDDLAYLKIDASGLPAATIAGDSPTVGQFVVVVGRGPDGGAPTATFGCVSAMGRLRQTAAEGERKGSALQVSARLNYGNSGGAVATLRGELIGIAGQVTHTVSDGEARKGQNSGVGFATSAGRLRALLPRLRSGEAIPARPLPFLGVGCDVAPGGEGALIREVVKGSPAERLGLKPADVILIVGETRIDSPIDLRFAIQQAEVGESMRLVVIRGKERLELAVTLQAREGGRR